MQTRSQQYACKAFDKVDIVKGTSSEKEYGALALNFPVMVLQSGLAQASGFILAKKRDGQLRYLNDLADVLDQNNGEVFHQQIIASSLGDYQRLTRHALEAAGWFKRYAQGHLNAKTTDTGDV
ncbi:MAG: type III-B CRISPR module-associated protein Cmr5 [Zoogloeaceae bacterium]|jgi:CRISPR-associated protein Cmr5|nr:type III-B CRISPR module-associated protein Cmr5 [Zoogloeaceae bacterium]